MLIILTSLSLFSFVKQLLHIWVSIMKTTSREQVDQTEVCNGKSVMYVLVIF